MTVIAQAPAASPITGATGGVFNVIPGEPGGGSQLSLGLEGSGKRNGQSFRVRVSGVVNLPVGTYTATVQPLLYASTTAGFTAAAASAIYSAAAISVTQSSASAAKGVPFTVEALLEGDTISGLLVGSVTGLVNNGAQQGATAPVAIVNAPTSINFTTEPPLQFAAGVTLGSGALSTSVSTLTQFQIEA